MNDLTFGGCRGLEEAAISTLTVVC